MKTAQARFGIPLLFLALCAVSAAAGQAQVIRLDGTAVSPAQIDATVTRSMANAHVPGVGIAIFDHGKIVCLKTYGLRDTERRLPLTPDSIMTPASLTKSVVTTLVMGLVRDGIIEFDKPIYTYLPNALPEYPRYHDLAGDPRYKQITMRMLLDHTSGFPKLASLHA